MKRVTPRLLRGMPLPEHDDDDDKRARGTAFIVGGSRLVPGAVMLAGVAALRAGAGVLQIGAPREMASAIGLQVPEALVVGMGSASSTGALAHYARNAQALAIGPGVMTRASSVALARRCVRLAGDETTVILDAAAIAAVGSHARCVITPHVGEMASLLEMDRSDVERNAPDAALEAAERFGCVVASASRRRAPVTHRAGVGSTSVNVLSRPTLLVA